MIPVSSSSKHREISDKIHKNKRHSELKGNKHLYGTETQSEIKAMGLLGSSSEAGKGGQEFGLTG